MLIRAMTFDRRTVVAGLGAVLPASLMSSCARASDAEWPGPDTPANELPKLPIGMNLAGIASWEPGFPFRNLMWGAGQWLSRNSFGPGSWDSGQAEYFEYDKDGYPLEIPIQTGQSKGIPQFLAVLLPNVLTPGKYIIYFDGEGSIEGISGTKVISESPGRVTIYMTQKTDVPEGILIRWSKRGNHVRNIRIISEKDSLQDVSKNPFRKEFLEFCKPFHCLRFMDWGATNNSLEDQWSTRKRPTFYTMAGASGDADGFFGPKPKPFQTMFAGGVAHEIIIDLSNRLKIDPWICIPHRATDEYISSLSRLYRDNLDPGRKIYLEYSNEVWNWGFLQSTWMLRSELAGDLVARKGVDAWQIKNGEREPQAFPQRIGALLTRAFKLWLEEWPLSDRHRITRVCAVQAGWAATAIATIDWCKDDGLTTAVAAAAYFAPTDAILAQWENKGATLTGDQVIQDMWSVIEKQGRRDASAYRIAQRAQAHGFDYLNYEAGQHIVAHRGKDTAYSPALAAAQQHPEMYRLYVENMRLQKRLGVKLSCAFNSIGRQGMRWGSWGAKESYQAPDNERPKMKALLDCNV